MSENNITRLNELKEDFFKIIVEENASELNKFSPIFKKNTGDSGYSPISVGNILKNNNNADNEDSSKDIQSRIDELKQKKTANESKVNNKKSDINDTESSISDTKSEISTTRSALSALKAPNPDDYKKMVEDENGGKEEFDEAAYNKAMTTYLLEKARLERKLQIEEDKLKSYESQLSTQKEKLSELEEEGNEIELEISELESEKTQASQQSSANQTENEDQEEKTEEEKEEEEKKEREKDKSNITSEVNSIIQEVQEEISSSGIGSVSNIFSNENFEQNINETIDKITKAQEDAEEGKINIEKIKAFFAQEQGNSISEDDLTEASNSIPQSSNTKEHILRDDDFMSTYIDGIESLHNVVSTEKTDEISMDKVATALENSGVSAHELITLINKMDKDHNGSVSKTSVTSLYNVLKNAETEEEAIAMIEDEKIIIENADSEEEVDEALSKIKDKRSLHIAAKLVSAGVPLKSIIECIKNNKDLEELIKLVELGNIDGIESILENKACKENLYFVIQLAELGRSSDEIIQIINNPNCRKAMAEVVKLVEKNKSTSEIIKMFNNPNSLMNLNQTVELASEGKSSDEIEKIFNDSNAIGNLDTAIKLSKKNISASNIVGMLNDSKVKKVLTGNEIVDFAEELSNNKKAKTENTDENTNNTVNSKTENAQTDIEKYGVFKSIVANMSYNNVKENDIYKLLSGNNTLNEYNHMNSNTANNLIFLEMELLRKKNA